MFFLIFKSIQYLDPPNRMSFLRLLVLELSWVSESRLTKVQINSQKAAKILIDFINVSDISKQDNNFFFWKFSNQFNISARPEDFVCWAYRKISQKLTILSCLAETLCIYITQEVKHFIATFYLSIDSMKILSKEIWNNR